MSPVAGSAPGDLRRPRSGHRIENFPVRQPLRPLGHCCWCLRGHWCCLRPGPRGAGLNLVLVARRAQPLVALAGELEARHPVSVQPLSLDLGEPESITELLSVTDDREIGLLVWNAALSVMGPFLDQPLDAHLTELEVNIRSPLRTIHALGGRMVARRRGGIILLSSLSGMQGTALVANYAATKAWNRVLAEGLWWELGKNGVDVLACVAGATDTPGYRGSAPSPGSDGNGAGAIARRRGSGSARAHSGSGPASSRE